MRAENKCRRLKVGNVDYSPKIGIARLTIELWKGVTTRKKVKNTVSELDALFERDFTATKTNFKNKT